MNLREAQEELKKLDNEYKYWLGEKEIALSIVLPKATDIKEEVVDGGKRVDKMLKYIELLESKQIDQTLDYIHKKQQNLMNYIENELKIIGQFSYIEKRIYDLRNDSEYIRTHNKPMPFWIIGNQMGLSDRHVRRIYSKLVNKRNV